MKDKSKHFFQNINKVVLNKIENNYMSDNQYSNKLSVIFENSFEISPTKLLENIN